MPEVIDTGIAPSTGPVNDCIRHGDHVWLVVISEDPATGEIVTGDIAIQTRRTLDNLTMALEAAGGTLSNVVQVQIFLTESADAKAMNAVYAEYFSKPYPVRATVVVKDLFGTGPQNRNHRYGDRVVDWSGNLAASSAKAP